MNHDVKITIYDNNNNEQTIEATKKVIEDTDTTMYINELNQVVRESQGDYVVDYTYDEDGRFTRIKQSDGYVHTFEYDGDNVKIKCVDNNDGFWSQLDYVVKAEIANYTDYEGLDIGIPVGINPDAGEFSVEDDNMNYYVMSVMATGVRLLNMEDFQ